MSICLTQGCINIANKGRYCNTCASRKYRKNNPLRYAYHALKDNAKRRGKAFELSFEEFKLFVRKVDYMKKKGVTAEAYHIDRIDETRGYTLGNLQILTNSDNVRKYLDYRWNEQAQKMEFKNVTLKQPVFEDVPF